MSIHLCVKNILFSINIVFAIFVDFIFFLFWYFIFKLRVKIWKEIVSEFESRFLTIFKLVRITIIIITQQQLDALSNSMTDEFTSKSFVRKKRAEKEESLK